MKSFWLLMCPADTGFYRHEVLCCSVGCVVVVWVVVGWAATARFNGIVRSELERFKSRPDTFSFGVCNGCQLMALLGWIVPDEHGIMFFC